ncbi:uncharacterized protein [Aegilops tauschii subsp. strangulata]|uniref:uncharacterized protein n=1 Tax=Aegilops tauschii subsp. strangulata TaxID=200361 RepID=UPI003CC86AC5
MRAVLEAEATREEVKAALDHIGDLKAPGPDGMPSIVYKQHWHFMGDKVVDEVLSVLNGGSIPEGWNDTMVVLIPKVKNPSRIKDLRPISLCSVIYKLVSKVIANRLKLVLPDIISDNQSAFVPGRMITDNVLIAYELSHYLLNKKKGQEGVAAVKADMSKAHDRVEEEVKAAVKNALQIQSENWNDKYLGLPVHVGKSRKKAFSFVKNAIAGRVYGWKEKLIAKVGKEMLVTTVARAIPTFSMSCFYLTKSFCDEISSLIGNYWWSQQDKENTTHWISWKKLTEPKCHGGLGFRDMHGFNPTMLSWQIWRLIQCLDSLCARILQARYYPNKHILEAELKDGISY